MSTSKQCSELRTRTNSCEFVTFPARWLDPSGLPPSGLSAKTWIVRLRVPIANHILSCAHSVPSTTADVRPRLNVYTWCADSARRSAPCSDDVDEARRTRWRASAPSASERRQGFVRSLYME